MNNKNKKKLKSIYSKDYEILTEIIKKGGRKNENVK